jgi:hypothetical protein
MFDHRARPEEIIGADPQLMGLLEYLRSLALPQWRLVAGAPYQTVWNDEQIAQGNRRQGLRRELIGKVGQVTSGFPGIIEVRN